MDEPTFDTAEQALEDIQAILAKLSRSIVRADVVPDAMLYANTLHAIQERIDQWRNPA